MNGADGVRVEVATFAKVFTPEKYGMFPTTAAVEVESPPKPMVAPPKVIGHVTEMAFCFAFHVEADAMPPSAKEPARVFANVSVPALLVMVVDAVSPFQAVDEVAKVTAPVTVCPGTMTESTPVFVMLGETEPTTVKAEHETPEEQDADEVATL